MHVLKRSNYQLQQNNKRMRERSKTVRDLLRESQHLTAELQEKLEEFKGKRVYLGRRWSKNASMIWSPTKMKRRNKIHLSDICSELPNHYLRDSNSQLSCLTLYYEINKLIHHVEHCNEENIFMSLNITIILIWLIIPMMQIVVSLHLISVLFIQTFHWSFSIWRHANTQMNREDLQLLYNFMVGRPTSIYENK